jgi:hypothetical protein
MTCIQTEKDSDVKSGEQTSIWLDLPADNKELILEFVMCVDTLGILECLCLPETNPFLPTNVSYRLCCERIYYLQNVASPSIPLRLNISKWNGSWKNLITHRPRVRTNGFYCLKFSFFRRPCNDNFWEEQNYDDIITKFYRYIRFYADGSCVYALDTVPPTSNTAWQQLDKYNIIPKKTFFGYYLVTCGKVIVIVDLGYSIQRFTLNIDNMYNNVVYDVYKDDNERSVDMKMEAKNLNDENTQKNNNNNNNNNSSSGSSSSDSSDSSNNNNNDRDRVRGMFCHLKLVEHISLSNICTVGYDTRDNNSTNTTTTNNNNNKQKMRMFNPRSKQNSLTIDLYLNILPELSHSYNISSIDNEHYLHFYKIWNWN